MAMTTAAAATMALPRHETLEEEDTAGMIGVVTTGGSEERRVMCDV